MRNKKTKEWRKEWTGKKKVIKSKKWRRKIKVKLDGEEWKRKKEEKKQRWIQEKGNKE